MYPKKAVIILIIIAIILAIIFIFIYYRQNLGQDLDRSKNKAADTPKPLTDEKKQPIDILRILNNNSGKINNNLTPAQAQAKKQELLNMLDTNDKIGQSLSPANRQKKKQELLDFIK